MNRNPKKHRITQENLTRSTIKNQRKITNMRVKRERNYIRKSMKNKLMKRKKRSRQQKNPPRKIMREMLKRNSRQSLKQQKLNINKRSLKNSKRRKI